MPASILYLANLFKHVYSSSVRDNTPAFGHERANGWAPAYMIPANQCRTASPYFQVSHHIGPLALTWVVYVTNCNAKITTILKSIRLATLFKIYV
jgi:hypothetical protein